MKKYNVDTVTMKEVLELTDEYFESVGAFKHETRCWGGLTCGDCIFYDNKCTIKLFNKNFSIDKLIEWANNRPWKPEIGDDVYVVSFRAFGQRWEYRRYTTHSKEHLDFLIKKGLGFETREEAEAKWDELMGINDTDE